MAFRDRIEYAALVRDIRKPVIAALKGWVLGGGMEIALAADIRIAGRGAKIGGPEVTRGWLGGGGASQMLPRLVGVGQAMRMLLTGDPVDADTALRIGLVEEVIDDGNVGARAMEIARENRIVQSDCDIRPSRPRCARRCRCRSRRGYVTRMNSTSCACRTRAALKASRLSRKSATRGFSVLRLFPRKWESSSTVTESASVCTVAGTSGCMTIPKRDQLYGTIFNCSVPEQVEIVDVSAGAGRDRDRAGADRHDLAALQPPAGSGCTFASAIAPQ